MPQQAHTFEKRITKIARLKYWLHLPQDYGVDADKKWPLILFLHGMGERGDDLDLVKIHGVAKIADQQAKFPFIVVSPQCPLDSWWSCHLDALGALLDEITQTYAVDQDRVYLTGLSMGGYGTWHLAVMFPDRFAAIAPICGGGAFYIDWPERLRAIKHVPVWNFHGAQDDAVPIAESENMVEALQACGGDVRFTIYPDTEHDSWTETYNNPELYDWFLSHTRDKDGEPA